MNNYWLLLEKQPGAMKIPQGKSQKTQVVLFLPLTTMRFQAKC